MFHQEEEEEQRSELLSMDVFQPDAGPAEQPGRPRDDDLDSLFDGATQQVSGALSPAPSGADSSSPRSSSSAADVKGTLASDRFEDDWDDDDLLNDSLLLDMTQNLHKFTSPKFCSTQKPAGHQPSTGSRLGSSPASSDTRQKRVPSGRAVGSEWTRRVTSDQREPAGGSSSAGSHQNSSPRGWKTAGDDPVWDDPVWDDPADEQLLCELCEDLEKRLQKERPPPSQPRAALQPASRNLLPPSRTPVATACVSKVPGQTGFQPAPKRSSQYAQFTFKKPVNPVTLRTGGGGAGLTSGGPSVVPAAASCSAAEIEQKKQQAIQRRRRRLELAQGPGPPT